MITDSSYISIERLKASEAKQIIIGKDGFMFYYNLFANPYFLNHGYVIWGPFHTLCDVYTTNDFGELRKPFIPLCVFKLKAWKFIPSVGQ